MKCEGWIEAYKEERRRKNAQAGVKVEEPLCMCICVGDDV